MIHTQNVDHLANSWKSKQVDLSFGFQVGICVTLLEFQQWRKYVLLQFDFPQYPKFDEPSIRQ
jgi:hypothetical protein